MATAFTYRPKFVDIRVNKPDAQERLRSPGERPCDHQGCLRSGDCRAPKGRGFEGQYWWFCQDHAGEYNRRFNYFQGMSDAELMDYAASEAIGHRPTWSFKAGRGDRLSAAFRRGARRADPFGLFNDGEDPRAPEPRRPQRTRLQLLALETLSLDERASPQEIRAKYAELVKRFHPDVAGGDRSAEDRLNRVIRAYQTLKASGLA